jgi:hypothetical protein
MPFKDYRIWLSDHGPCLPPNFVRLRDGSGDATVYVVWQQ